MAGVPTLVAEETEAMRKWGKKKNEALLAAYEAKNQACLELDAQEEASRRMGKSASAAAGSATAAEGRPECAPISSRLSEHAALRLRELREECQQDEEPSVDVQKKK